MSSLSPAVRERIERLRGGLARAREKAREGVTVATHTGIATLAAGAVGYDEARRQLEGKAPREVFGAAMETAVGLAAHALAFTSVGREFQEHLRAAGDGLLSVAAYKKGKEFGSHPPGAPGLPGT